MRAKRKIIHDLYTQMKIHGLTTSCTYNEYKAVVGSAAINPRSIAKGWRGRWSVVMSQLKNTHPDIDVVINTIEKEPAPKPIPKKKVEPKPKDSGLEALSKKPSAIKKED